MTKSDHSDYCNGSNCEHSKGSCKHNYDDRCCWATALEAKQFQERVKHKYILEVIFDMIISTTSVITDIVALILYFHKGKYAFALLTAIPVLLPTFVFTNVYLADESTKKPASRVVSVISDGRSRSNATEKGEPSFNEKVNSNSSGVLQQQQSFESDSRENSLDNESIGSSSMHLEENKESKRHKCLQNCMFHWSCFKLPLNILNSCISGCFQCFCNRDHKLRRGGAIAVKNSLQRLLKYGFGTFVLRIIAWIWYIKALIFGVKAYREPKKYMHIATPDTHWSYQLLVRLDFLQAGLENAPQCVIQLYALITQPDENVGLGLLTLIISFVDFIRVVVSVHWDMDKGPVAAPRGCYKTLLWNVINALSWIFTYAARSAAIALVVASSGVNGTRITVLFPAAVFTIHIILFGKLLSKAEYGIAAQKIVTTVFISLFFLPELDLSVLPHTIQFYYATITIQNTFFILPWRGFDQEYCVTSGSYYTRPTRPPPPGPNATVRWTTTTRIPITLLRDFQENSTTTSEPVITTTEAVSTKDCLIDPTWISLAVPSMTIFGVIFRLVASQKMLNYKKTIANEEMRRKRDETQNKLEASITKIFSKHWAQMTVREMFRAFLRMLKKEVIIMEKDSSNEETLDHADQSAKNKKHSFLAGRLQAEFLASQTFIRESFSLMTRSTRSHDTNVGQVLERAEFEGKPEPPTEYNSDSELTFRKNFGRVRPRIPRSRNVSDSVDVVEPSPQTTYLQIDLPAGGTQFLEMCWI